MSKSKLWRKRVADGRQDPDAFSSTLREAIQSLDGGQFAAGLSLLNSLAAGELTQAQQTQVLSSVADGQMLQGQFADAASTYQNAIGISAGNMVTGLRPSIGNVIALLKAVQVDQAATAARLLVEAVASYIGTTIDTSTLIVGGSTITVKPKIQSASTVARRLGRIFLAEGESELAAEFLNQAVSLQPEGNIRAKFSLARLAAQQGDVASAHDQALSAWQSTAKPTAKMLAAIPLLINTANRTNRLSATTNAISSGLISARRSVRARGTLLLVQALRAEHQAEAWINQATAWLQSADAAKVPVVAAEMRKFLLTEQRTRNNSPADEQTAALAVLSTPRLGFREYLSAAKELIRSTYFLGQTPDITSLLNNGIDAYGAKF